MRVASFLHCDGTYFSPEDPNIYSCIVDHKLHFSLLYLVVLVIFKYFFPFPHMPSGLDTVTYDRKRSHQYRLQYELCPLIGEDQSLAHKPVNSFGLLCFSSTSRFSLGVQLGQII